MYHRQLARQVPPFSIKFHPSVQNSSVLQLIYHQHPPLDEQIKQAKLRAQKLGLATDSAEWGMLLKTCKVTIINSAVDLAKVDGHMMAFERGMLTTQEDEIDLEVRATKGVTL